MANLKVYGIGPDEVWVALHGRRRLSRPLGEDGAAIFGVTSADRYLMVLVVESTRYTGRQG